MQHFSVSEELALPTKPTELDTNHSPWRWVDCNCAPSSPCFSRARCDALATHRRVPSVPPELQMPDILATRAMVRWVGTNEPFMVDAITSILRASCFAPDAVFVDSGMNEGMWTLLGAHFGCRTIGIEPQPQCLSSVREGLRINGLSARVINAFLAPRPMTATIDTSAACLGGFQPVGPARAARDARHKRVASFRLDDLDELKDPHTSVALWHLDVEGAEIPVLRSATKLFAARRIERVLFEVSLRRWDKFGIASKQAGLDELRAIFAGWTCTWACNGRPFPWTPVARRAVYCAPPWNEHSDLGWGLFDVFCVAPGIVPMWNATRPSVSKSGLL
jgi:FkbM family methyltransferase